MSLMHHFTKVHQKSSARLLPNTVGSVYSRMFSP
uniref:Uncharacterized protein n=1 Tax=Anguilla anguilla TaxID=7936 RepID=A0A0E9TCQ6_ANGAN